MSSSNSRNISGPSQESRVVPAANWVQF